MPDLCEVTARGELLPASGRKASVARSTFGDVIILAYITCQVLDGAFTYVGVQAFGRAIEANPLISWLMGAVGEAPALAATKSVALALGAFLHLVAVHRVIAILVVVYLAAAVGPWTHLLFF
jgi:hypothetical protein